MSTQQNTDELSQSEQEEISKAFLRDVDACVETSNITALKDLVGELHSSDLADLIENLPAKRRNKFIRLMGDDFNLDTYAELE